MLGRIFLCITPAIVMSICLVVSRMTIKRGDHSAFDAAFMVASLACVLLNPFIWQIRNPKVRAAAFVVGLILWAPILVYVALMVVGIGFGDWL
jgi:hypothetical protein